MVADGSLDLLEALEKFDQVLPFLMAERSPNDTLSGGPVPKFVTCVKVAGNRRVESEGSCRALCAIPHSCRVIFSIA